MLGGLLLAAPPALAGPWVTPTGVVRVEAVASQWTADERFVGVPNDIGFAPGDKAPSLSSDVDDAELDYRQLALQLAIGVYEDVEVTAYVPFVMSKFEDANEVLETDGIGDIQLGANWRVAEPIAFGVELKIPVAEVETAARLPVSEGQYDLAFWQRSGLGFGWHGWAQLDVGYRIRFARDLEAVGVGDFKTDKARKPGNEFLARAGGGWRPGAAWDFNLLAVTLMLDGLFGQDGEDISNPDDEEKIDILPTKRRELIELQVGLLFGPWESVTASVTYGHPLYGLNYPAGDRLIANLGYAFQIW